MIDCFVVGLEVARVEALAGEVEVRDPDWGEDRAQNPAQDREVPVFARVVEKEFRIR